MAPLVLAVALAAPAAEPPSLLTELTTTGLAIPGGPRFQLPGPAMAPGLSADKKQAVVDKFAGEFPRGVFLRRDSAAPHVWKIESINGDNRKRRGHRLDLYFAAYGKVTDLDRQDILGALMGTNRKKGPNYLSDKQLAERKITRTDAKGIDERFVVLDLELIEKVQLSGVVRSQKQTDADGALVSVMVLDDRFADDKEYPNRWRAILEQRGERVGLGPPRPYSGFGGYVKTTPVKGDLIFLELHFAFAEPYDWFEGRNMLASKLPLALTNNVKTTRLKMMSAK
jgi:hypothetical protein